MITRDKEGHYIMIKGSIQEEDITIVNITQHRSISLHKTNTNRHKMRIDSNTIIVGDSNTPLTPMNR